MKVAKILLSVSLLSGSMAFASTKADLGCPHRLNSSLTNKSRGSSMKVVESITGSSAPRKQAPAKTGSSATS